MSSTFNKRSRFVLPMAFATAATITAITLAQATTALPFSVELITETVQGRAPVVVLAPLANDTAPGQPPVDGHVLRADASVTDPDGDAIESVTYRWLRDDLEVGTGPTYATTVHDAGRPMRVDAVATTNASITDPASGSTSLDFIVGDKPGSRPDFDGSVTMQGTEDASMPGAFFHGHPVYAKYQYRDDDGDLEDKTNTGTHFTWYNSCESSPVREGRGSAFDHYTPTVEDQRRRCRLMVAVHLHSLTGAPKDGYQRFSSWSTEVRGYAPTMTPALISGTLAVGQTLTGIVQGFHDPDGDPISVNFPYDWYRADDAAGTQNVQPVKVGYYEAVPNMVISHADVGKYLILDVQARSASGTPFLGEYVRSITPIPVPAPAP